jgi:hypothetical protein
MTRTHFCRSLDSVFHTACATCDLPHHSAYAKNGIDTKRIEDFIKSKVKKGSPVFQFKFDDEILAWYGLRLSLEAKEAVENYEGIKKVSTGSKMKYNRALPNAST